MIRMLEDVKQITIGPLIRSAITEGSVAYSDGYDIDSRREEWGGEHRTVRHAEGE
jgi:hypothetical protein